MASETTTKPKKSIKEWRENMRNGLTKAKAQIGEYAQKLGAAESSTRAAHKQLEKVGASLEETTQILSVQTEAIDQQTSAGHRAGIDGTGMVAAVAVDLLAFEGLSTAAAKWPFILRNRKWLSGAPHLAIGVSAYAMSLKNRADNPGHFGSVPGQITEEAAKHLIVLGATNIAKGYLAP